MCPCVHNDKFIEMNSRNVKKNLFESPHEYEVKLHCAQYGRCIIMCPCALYFYIRLTYILHRMQSTINTITTTATTIYAKISPLFYESFKSICLKYNPDLTEWDINNIFHTFYHNHIQRYKTRAHPLNMHLRKQFETIYTSYLNTKYTLYESGPHIKNSYAKNSFWDFIENWDHIQSHSYNSVHNYDTDYTYPLRLLLSIHYYFADCNSTICPWQGSEKQIMDLLNNGCRMNIIRPNNICSRRLYAFLKLDIGKINDALQAMMFIEDKFPQYTECVLLQINDKVDTADVLRYMEQNLIDDDGNICYVPHHIDDANNKVTTSPDDQPHLDSNTDPHTAYYYIACGICITITLLLSNIAKYRTQHIDDNEYLEYM